MKTLSLKAHSFYYALCLIALSSLISSCEKDDQTGPGNTYTSPACLITKYYNADDPTDNTVYRYDSQNRTIKWTWSYQGKEKGVGTYEYNPQGQLVKLTVKDKYLENGQFTLDVTDITTFEYNSKGQVAKFVEQRPTPQSGNYARAASEVTWEYDSEGNRTRSTRTYSGNSTQYTSEFTYQGGNCTKAVFFKDSPSELVEEYEYYLDQEDKQRPSAVLTKLTGQTANKNMIKKTVRTSKQGNLDATFQYSYDYQVKRI
jgi:hypothetical protein